jgi:hypothetical protein
VKVPRSLNGADEADFGPQMVVGSFGLRKVAEVSDVFIVSAIFILFLWTSGILCGIRDKSWGVFFGLSGIFS